MMDAYDRPEWHESNTSEFPQTMPHKRAGRIAAAFSRLRDGWSWFKGEPDPNLPSFVDLVANGIDALDQLDAQHKATIPEVK
jgi:hypothetical protein